jgi:arsenate reductase
MAEAYLNKFGGKYFIAKSAGIEAGTLNPFAVEVMKEDGIDISNNATKSVFDFYKEGKIYQYVVTVCDEGNAAKCPIFPGVHRKISWSFDDPSQFNGTDEEKLQATRKVRNKIREAVINLIEELGHTHSLIKE